MCQTSKWDTPASWEVKARNLTLMLQSSSSLKLPLSQRVTMCEKEMATHSSVLAWRGAWWAAICGVAQS